MHLPNLSKYKHTIRELSDRLVDAQRSIHVLNALKWPEEVRAEFFAKKCKELPKVTEDTYTQGTLNFDPDQKTEEFYTLERDIRRQLGQFSGVANIMLRMCREYREVIRLVLSRGTSEFPKISQELYGSAQDAFYAGAPTLKDLATLVSNTCSSQRIGADPLNEKIYTSEKAMALLRERLKTYFHDPDEQVHVKLSDDILSDASAGAEWIKLRQDAMFSERELKVLEVHEGWVHVGTTMNGLSQPVCTFLSKGPPSSTLNQEGLAIIMEIFTFSSYPARIQRLTNRVTAIDMVEEGGNFLDVFNFYKEKGYEEDESYYAAMRVFRGSLPDKGPFTKDLSYSKGFILIYNYIRLAIKNGYAQHIPLLFLGKTTLEDLPVLQELMQQGIVTPPKYLPPQFADLAGLTAWMTYSLFLNQLSLSHLDSDYRGIF